MTTYECYECPNRHCRAANSQEDRPGRSASARRPRRAIVIQLLNKRGEQ